jgi:hypothetical protein
MFSLQLQKSLTPDFKEKCGIPRHFKGHFPIGNVQVRILPGQPGSPAVGRAPQEKREWARNAGFSRVRFCLRTPVSPDVRWKLPKVSGLLREYSRFAETFAGDRVRPRLPREGTSAAKG